jgi:hypothetical protein
VVCTWPQVYELGQQRLGPLVVCEDCTREAYNLGDSDTLAVWVRLENPQEAIVVENVVMKPATRRGGKPVLPQRPKSKKRKSGYDPNKPIRKDGLW